MPEAVIHFTSRSISKSKLTKLARAARKRHQSLSLMHDSAVRVQGDDAKEHDKFLKQYRRQSKRGKLSVFHDHLDAKHSMIDKLKSHARIAPERLQAEDAAVSATAAGGRTANVMSAFYNMPPQNVSKDGKPPVIAIISFGGSFLASDLHTYWAQASGMTTFPTAVYTVSVDRAVYRFTGTGADYENALDLQLAGGICPSATLLFFSAPNTDLGFYDAIHSAMIGATIGGVLFKPNVISISWGAPESMWSASTISALNQLFKMAADQGITVTAASGDSGSNDGLAGSVAHVDFPASSPWVVACGGTSLTSALSGVGETAWSWNTQHLWGGGGGISQLSIAAPFQTQKGINVPYPSSSVSSTLAKLSGHRAVPDVALNADPLTGWTIVLNGKTLVSAMGGTSCVAPALAGLVGLMNLAFTSSSNGFASNLYGLFASTSTSGTTLRSTYFHDVTSGNNDNVTKSTSVTRPLFSAGSGYDFCTGLGSLNGTNVLKAFQASGLKTR
jgi:kumamolisin